jgi:hypothetical protein
MAQFFTVHATHPQPRLIRLAAEICVMAGSSPVRRFELPRLPSDDARAKVFAKSRRR